MILTRIPQAIEYLEKRYSLFFVICASCRTIICDSTRINILTVDSELHCCSIPNTYHYPVPFRPSGVFDINGGLLVMGIEYYHGVTRGKLRW